MFAKYFITGFCLFVNTVCYSQAKDTSLCDQKNSKIDTSVAAFIKGKKGKQKIKWKFFYKEFELNLSDPTYEIIQFAITRGDHRKDMIVSRINIGKVVTPNLEYSNLPDVQNYSLYNVGPGDIITFDIILVKKEGKCFRIRSFLIYTTL